MIKHYDVTNKDNNILFSNIISKLDQFFQNKGCIVIQPYSIVPIGAATFHPATVLYTLTEEVWNICWAQQCSRPDDSRDGQHCNRRQRFYQYQVIMKPAPEDTLDMIRSCLNFIGLDIAKNDIKFIKDDWKSPTLGATGIGWEVSCNGTEICQLTYMQQLASRNCNPIALEITFGIERLISQIQKVDNFDKILYVGNMKYNQIYNRILSIEEKQFAQYNVSLHNTKTLIDKFDYCSSECHILLNKGLCLPAYKFVCEACDVFNLLCSKGVLSVVQKEEYTIKVRDLVRLVCEKWIEIDGLK
ncbi:MAG: glycine--tRNA ligase subunit alpha [Pseudomonadota bacterium]